MNPQIALARDIGGFFYNPLGFVHYNFPWGRPGSYLAQHDGPDTWQTDVLHTVGQAMRESDTAVRVAVTSGNGSGKTALISWLIDWFMSTRMHPAVAVTANTKTQLITKTWRELALWHELSLNKDWFDCHATSFRHKQHSATWQANAIPWNASRPEAIAGTHAAAGVLIVMDEASSIDAAIWDAIEGALTTKGVLWVVFGNPTRSSGKFYDCFHSMKHRWITRQVDTRTCKMANQAQLKEWAEDYGEDSDFFRVRVKGQFPRTGTLQFFPPALIDLAMARSRWLKPFAGAPRILGADVARFGDDFSVIAPREGNVVHPLVRWNGTDTTVSADRIAQFHDEWKPDALMVDGGGPGAGVVDRLRLLNYSPIEVIYGSAADNKTKYANRRAEIYGKTLDWLRGEVALPQDANLEEQLKAVEYGLNIRDQIQLEKKADMKARGLPSPDDADALATGFDRPVAPQSMLGRSYRELRERNSNWRLA